MNSSGEWHSFQMQRLQFRAANDRDHLDLHHVGLFPDGKLPFDYIWSYGLKLDESRTIEVHRNLSLFPRICSFTFSSCRFAVDFGEFLIPLRIRDVEGIALCLHNPNGNPLARVVLLLPPADQLRTEPLPHAGIPVNRIPFWMM